MVSLYRAVSFDRKRLKQLLLCQAVDLCTSRYVYVYCMYVVCPQTPDIREQRPCTDNYYWRAKRAYLVVRMARFFYMFIYIYIYIIGARALFPDIRCLRITFDPPGPCFMLYTRQVGSLSSPPKLSEPTCRVYSMKQGPGGSKVIRKHRISGNSARAPKKYIYKHIESCHSYD